MHGTDRRVDPGHAPQEPLTDAAITHLVERGHVLITHSTPCADVLLVVGRGQDEVEAGEVGL